MSNAIEVKVPDMGGVSHVDVIELLVQPGDIIEQETPLITVESDKASMDIPSPVAGKVESIVVKLGDRVSEGDTILSLFSHAPSEEPAKVAEPTPVSQEKTTPSMSIETEEEAEQEDTALLSAGPATRRLARELGVDLALVKGTGRKGRISKEDLQEHVKSALLQKNTGGVSFPVTPEIDFQKFGAVERKPLSKIKQLTATNVHRSWVTIPQVTQFDEADVTELEEFRKQQQVEAAQQGYKLTLLAFVAKALASALQKFPQFNASLASNGQELIYKQYVNIGIAVETPNGLVVPVIKGVDTLSVSSIAKEMARLSQDAREKGVSLMDMSGSCCTISSLGGIGGTAFTPIVNSPEVAILGLSRTAIKPVFCKDSWQPRRMLPLSLSYDHRVIDGAEAARFTAYIASILEDIRRILL